MTLLEEIIEDWIAESEAHWDLGILDTQPGYKGDIYDITDYYLEIEWDWYLKDNGVKEESEEGVEFLYVEENQFGHRMKWCGVGLAAMGRQIGDLSNPTSGYKLKKNFAYFVLPSTTRLADPKKWSSAVASKPPGFDGILKRGDIVTIGSREIGSHVTMVTGLSENEFHTIEFNAYGEMPDGSRKEGIVKNTHAYTEIKKVYSPAMDWFTKVSE